MTEKNFVAFYEHCGWEGETWRFWLQIAGNVEAFEKFDEKIEEFEELQTSDWYVEFDYDQVLPESSVDVLVKNSQGGYLSYENKVTGLFQTDKLDELTDEEKFTDALYKGGIERFFNE